MNILVVVAHLDDETFGMYGTIKKLARKNKVIIYNLCKGRDDENSTSRLKTIFGLYDTENILVDKYYDLHLDDEYKKEIASSIHDVINENNIDIVYTNSMDLHNEHQIVNQCTKVAVRNTAVKKLLEIYIPGSSDIKNFPSEYVVEININEKLNACKKYKTEVNKNTINKIKRAGQFIGSKYNLKSAELFNVVFNIEV
jgi:LmbE family N-acetylglucosaminyl deacetylase